jgi:NAD(P)-dependent dehydrogenase (short-subunit alcohol dehydrogenase family)
MDLGLRKQRAVVTGAGRGIGLAIATALAEEGCDLDIVARDSGVIATVGRQLAERHKVQVRSHALDLSTPEGRDELFHAAPEADILVNNAGAVPPGPIDEFTDASWLAGWELKILGYIGLTRRYYGTMKQRRSGVIINIVGMGGVRPNARAVAIGSGNAAIIALTQALGAESPQFGVRVVGVNPGPTGTDRALTIWRKEAEQKFGSADRWQELVSHLPFGRPAAPEEVAAAVLFLASTRAGYISGSLLNIDGGMGSRT